MRALVCTAVIGILASLYAFTGAPSPQFPTDQILKIESGQTIASVAAELGALGAVRSPFVFELIVRLTGGVQAGWYDLDVPESAFVLAWRLQRGETRLKESTVTIPEGASVRDISLLLGIELPRSEEGFLFPDTYQFLPGSSKETIVARMRARYDEAIEPLRSTILEGAHTELEIITMASILEKEARLPETRRLVAGILWKRLAMGMPLQVDAVFGYIYDTPTFHPTFDDLKIDSPYNTYQYRGLPPGPINNPGLDTIKAALEPTKSPYLYYLTGKDGTMHYARTFEEHVANRRFLR